MKYTLSTQAVEGIAPSQEAISLCQQISDGKISANQAIEIIKEKYGVVSAGDFKHPF